MSAVDQLFLELRTAGRKALIPFITAGDPDLDFTRDLVRELAARGCHLCEIGIPYSDPIADGPVIQASYTRALAKRVKLADILQTIGDLRTTGAGAVAGAGAAAGGLRAMPIVTMVSYAIVLRHGMARYVAEAKAQGVAGAIVPDLLVEEADELAAICRREDFSLIQLVTPTTPRERALRIAERSTGFLYYVSVTGITGERTKLPADLVDNVGWLRERSPLPICIGFGISSPDHVALLRPVADGLIVGSAIVRQMATADTVPRRQVLDQLGDYVAKLLAALNP